MVLDPLGTLGSVRALSKDEVKCLRSRSDLLKSDPRPPSHQNSCISLCTNFRAKLINFRAVEKKPGTSNLITLVIVIPSVHVTLLPYLIQLIKLKFPDNNVITSFVLFSKLLR